MREAAEVAQRQVSAVTAHPGSRRLVDATAAAIFLLAALCSSSSSDGLPLLSSNLVEYCLDRKVHGEVSGAAARHFGFLATLRTLKKNDWVGSSSGSSGGR
jgi:hypothetical protein